METGNLAGASLPLGDLLITEDPVWVWDAGARRILWANPAGRKFWGAKSLESLRARRFSPRNKSVERLRSLAFDPGGVQERVETLTLSAASGHRSVKCHLQGLEVAGGRPGLIVKAIDFVDDGNATRIAGPAEPVKKSRPKKASKPRASGAKSDRAALDAIGSRLKKTPKSDPRPVSPIAAKLSTSPAPEFEADAVDHINSNSLERDASGSPSVDRDMQPVPILHPALALSVRELCHELRNPLTVILGFAERIKDIAPAGRSEERLHAYASDIIESANLASAILADFSARILLQDDRNRQPEPADLRTAVESSIRLVTPLAKAAGIRLHRRLKGALPSLLMGERILKQILLNLLMNALRHHKSGGQIKVAASCRKDGKVRLAISDDGKGMSKKEIKRALKNPRTTLPPQPGRSGLGLPLVKRLVDDAGGKLSIESARGKGTMVEILFPAGG